MSEILQLKPKEDAFLKVARNITKRKLDIIFVCEGKRDSEVLKGLISKIFGVVGKNLAVTDCEGKDSISEIALDIATLAQLSRTLKRVAILIDADEHDPKARASSLCNSLRAKIGEIKLIELGTGFFKIELKKFEIEVFLKVAGDLSLHYKKHTIDDYIVRLLILENEIQEEDASRYTTAKECVNEFLETKSTTVKNLILNAQMESVQKAFEDVINYLECFKTFLMLDELMGV